MIKLLVKGIVLFINDPDLEQVGACAGWYDDEKQGAINLFLGHFQPRLGASALWALDSDHYLHSGARAHAFLFCQHGPYRYHNLLECTRPASPSTEKTRVIHPDFT